MAKLNPQHQKFADRYVVHGNASLAYIEAGYTGTPDAVSAHASRLVGNGKVSKYIADRQAVLAARAQVKQEQIVDVLKAFIFSDISEYLTVTPSGVTLKSLEDIPEEKRRAISEVVQIENKEGTNVRYKLHDKIEAIKELNRMLGFHKEVDAGGPGGGTHYTVNVFNLAHVARQR